MSRSDFLEASIENLIATYVEVGSRVEGATVENQPGLVVCRSPLDHPLANFALCRPDRLELASIGRLARPLRSFNFYLLPGVGQREAAAALRKSGWRSIGALQLLAGGRPRGIGTARLRGLSRFEERLEAARFLCRNFFPKMPASSSDAIALATAQAGGGLFCLEDNGPNATVMLSRRNEALGIYSLCVEPSARGHGWGSSIMEAVLRMADSEDLTSVLQCEAGLVRWYRTWGFASCGEIRIFA